MSIQTESLKTERVTIKKEHELVTKNVHASIYFSSLLIRLWFCIIRLFYMNIFI
jgi:hypothetical protein